MTDNSTPIDLAADFRVDGKVAIVTGAAGGIGEATARVLASAGATVVVADLNEESTQRVAADIKEAGGTSMSLRLDVSDPDAFTAAVATVVEAYGQLDILVNNAAVQNRRAILDITPDEFNKILSVNLGGVLYGSQAAARVMKPGSSIINTLSFIIDRATVGTGSYAASKKGAWALTHTCALEFAPLGIRVNGVAPGWTATTLSTQRTQDADGQVDPAKLDTLVEQMSAMSPMKTVMEPIDSARAVLYLTSAAGRHLTGQVIRVNGGATME